MLLNIKCKIHLVKSLLINNTHGSFGTSSKGWVIQPVMPWAVVEVQSLQYQFATHG